MDRINESKVTLSDHGSDRVCERVGGRKKTAARIAEEAYEKGLKHAETKGTLKKYLDAKGMNGKITDNVRIYHHQVWFFDDKKLITVYALPPRLCTLADTLQKKKDGAGAA